VTSCPGGWFSGPDLRIASVATAPAELPLTELPPSDDPFLRTFCRPPESRLDWIVPFLMSTFWIVPLRISLLVICVAA
jgi:hypothetical protein